MNKFPVHSGWLYTLIIREGRSRQTGGVLYSRTKRNEPFGVRGVEFSPDAIITERKLFGVATGRKL